MTGNDLAGEVLTKDFPVLDCDGHVVEPETVWSDYVEPEFRDAVRGGLWKQDYDDGGFEISLNGASQYTRKGQTAFFGAVMAPGMDKKRLSSLTMHVDEYPIPPGAYDPVARVRDCDLMGIDQAMLLPTVCGLWFSAIRDPHALARHGPRGTTTGWPISAEPTRPDCSPPPSSRSRTTTTPSPRWSRVAELGFHCVIIRPNIIADRYPTHPDFDPVWQAIQDRGLVAGIHPFPPTAPADCTGWIIDRIAEAAGLRRGIVSETLCFAHDSQTFLLTAFHHDLWTKFPTLKIAVLESNAAWLPYLLEKADARVEVWAGTRGTVVEGVPSKVFYGRSWVAFESDEDAVFETWRRFEDIGVWASDYPHFDAEDAWEGIEHLERWGVPAEVQAKLLGGNAYRMYGIQPELMVSERLPAPVVGKPA